MSEPEAASAADRQAAAEDRLYRVENLAGVALRLGVGLSVLIILFGITLSLFRTSSPIYQAHDYHELFSGKPEYAFPHTLSATVEGLLGMQGRAFVTLGVGILILTPILRVVISLIAFAMQKDRAFVIITALVLTILMLSLFLGRVEHGG